MKGIFAPLALLAAVLGFALWNGEAMTAETRQLRQQLLETDRLILSEDWPAVREALEESYGEWRRWQGYLHVVAQHAAAGEAEALYVRALALAEAEEAGELRAETAELRERLRLLAEMERFSIQNIL